MQFVGELNPKAWSETDILVNHAFDHHFREVAAF